MNFLSRSAAALSCLLLTTGRAAPAQTADYLAAVEALCRVEWPKNRTVTVVCHGHSVPAGYFKTPAVNALEAYPHHLRRGLAAAFPHAVINVIVTAVGGENAEQGAARFEADVLSLRPDVVTIDYALNDRRIGLERSRAAWTAMIQQALARGIKVILLTPSPDLGAAMTDPADPLAQHAAQVTQLAQSYEVGLADSFAAFQTFAAGGGNLTTLMSQRNHPNEAGHRLIADRLIPWFVEPPPH